MNTLQNIFLREKSFENYSDGAVSSELQIRRLPYPGTEYNTNRAAVMAAAQLLGGPDNCGTRLWWDQNPNF